MSPWQCSRAWAFRNAPRVHVCSLWPPAVCSAAAVKFDLLLCRNAACPVRRTETNRRCGLLSLLKPPPPPTHTHPSVTILKPGGLFTGISPIVWPVLWWNRFIWTVKGSASPRTSLILFAWDAGLRGNSPGLPGEETWRRRNRRCISERDSHAAHVTGLFVQLSLHSGADALHTHTHWLVSSTVSFTCGLLLWKGTVWQLRQKRGFSGRVCCGELQTTFLEPQTATGLRCDSLETCTSPYAESCCGSVGSERRPRKTWSCFAPIQVSFKPRLTPLYAWGRGLTPPLYATFKEGSFGTMRLERHLFFQTFALILISPRFFISAKQEAHGAGFYSGGSVDHKFCWIYSEQLLLRSCSHAFMLTTECTVLISFFLTPQALTDWSHCFHSDGEYIDFMLILESSV